MSDWGPGVLGYTGFFHSEVPMAGREGTPVLWQLDQFKMMTKAEDGSARKSGIQA